MNQLLIFRQYCFSHLATPRPAVFLTAEEVTPPGTVKVSWEDARRGRPIEVEYTILYHKDGDSQNKVTTLLVLLACNLFYTIQCLSSALLTGRAQVLDNLILFNKTISWFFFLPDYLLNQYVNYEMRKHVNNFMSDYCGTVVELDCESAENKCSSTSPGWILPVPFILTDTVCREKHRHVQYLQWGDTTYGENTCLR